MWLASKENRIKVFQVLFNSWSGWYSVLCSSILAFAGCRWYRTIAGRYGLAVTADEKTSSAERNQWRRIQEQRELTAPKRKASCPYCGEADFLIEPVADENAQGTHPLRQFEAWDEACGFPLAARWLAAGMSGQDAPGRLRAGLRRLGDLRYFLVEDPMHLADELAKKAAAYDDPVRREAVFQAEPDSLAAQQECLDCFLDFLPRRYPDLYEVTDGTVKINVKGGGGRTYRLADWAHAPFELAARLVQEDLILVREVASDAEHTEAATTAEGALAEVRGQMGNPTTALPQKTGLSSTPHVMAAAAVVFSFVGLKEKLGKPLEFIHAPVPGFEGHLRRTLNSFFAGLQPELPVWRNNWGIAPTGDLEEPLYGSTAQQDMRSFKQPTRADIESKWLKVEYQTLRRLPRSGYVLFTVKTMVDPLPELAKYPPAASSLAASIRGMTPHLRKYKGIDDEATAEIILGYLDELGSKELSADAAKLKSL